MQGESISLSSTPVLFTQKREEKMRVLIKTCSRVIRVFKRQPCKKNANVQPPAPARSGPDIATPITSSGCSAAVTVPDDEVASAAFRFAFVLENERFPLNARDQWWTEGTHRDRMHTGSSDAYAWLEPFIPVAFIDRDLLHRATMAWGPLDALALAKALRERIRTCRMHKQPYEHLLRALYGACVMSDFTQALRIEGRKPDEMIRHVDANDLRAIKVDYASVGYRCIESLGKTDRKWLVEAFGEPAGHQSCEAAFLAPWRNAVSRCYWAEYREACEAARSLDLPYQTMQEWLHERIKHTFTYHQNWQKRIADSTTWDADVRAALGAAWLASTKNLIVAGIDTTGLNDKNDEVTEIAAIRVTPSGKAVAEFNARIRPRGVFSVTGAKSSCCGARDDAGGAADDVMADFLKFAGEDPVFLHNAPFDMQFLGKAVRKAGKELSNPIHDTLPLARAAWPELGTYNLTALANHIGASGTSPCALSNAKTTLAVLLAARKVAASMQFHGGAVPAAQIHRAPVRDIFAPMPLSGEHAS